MDNKFIYTYSPLKNAEVEEIRRKYLPSEHKPDERLERLRQLDRSCEFPGQIAAIIAGIIGTALFAFGMITMFGSQLYVSGSMMSIGGLLIMAAAVPIFHTITKKRREQLAPEILKLSDEIENDPSV